MVAPDDNPCRQVDRRQCLLRMGSHLAAAESLVPRFAAAQTFTATSISQAAQDARRDVDQLARRADNLLRRTVAASSVPGARRGGLPHRAGSARAGACCDLQQPGCGGRLAAHRADGGARPRA